MFSEEAPRPRSPAQQAEELMGLIEAMRSHAAELAEHRMTMFRAYVGAGFSENQALDLCKTLP